MSYKRELILLRPKDGRIIPTELGRSRADEKKCALPQVRNYSLIHIILRGVLRISGKSISRGEVALLPEGIPHAFELDSDFDQIWIGFSGDGAPDLLRAFGIPTHKNSTFRLTGGEELLGSIEERFSEAMKTEDHTSVLELLLSILSHLGEYKNHAERSYVESAKLFMDRSFSHRITMEDVAASVRISEKHLCRLFVAELGIPPKDYLTERRLETARELLVSTDMLVKEVARSVGYSNEIAFSSAFRKRFGYPPSEAARRERSAARRFAK